MLKKYAEFVKGYEKETLITIISVVVEVIIDVIIPLLMANIIDKGITNGQMNQILKFGLYLVLCCIVSIVSGALSGWFCAKASAGFALNLRDKIFDQIQLFSFTNIDKFSTSSLVTRLTTDVTNVQNAFQVIVRICARAPLMIVFCTVMVFRINSQLALIFLAAIPVLGIGLVLLIMNATPMFEKAIAQYDNLNNIVQENIRGIRVVKGFSREKHEVSKFSKISSVIYKTYTRAETIVALNNPLLQFCLYTCTLVICYIGAHLIVNDNFTTGQLMSVLTYSSQILMSLIFLSTVLVMVMVSRASLHRIAEVLDEKSDIQNQENVMSSNEYDIEFNNVSFKYKLEASKRALNSINIKIEAGKTIGIVGPTGSGKSSLVQLIPRLYDATEGQILVGGVDVKNFDIEELRKHISIVLQKNILFEGTILDNIRWGKPDATEDEVYHACVIAQADEFIQRLPDKYETRIEQGGSNVSGGQKQRLCIARALIGNPKIIIFDDSTSAVDTKTDALIQKNLQLSIPGSTKITIAQRISSVENADMIIVLDNGEVESVGNHQELLKSSEIYREMYESQMNGGIANE